MLLFVWYIDIWIKTKKFETYVRTFLFLNLYFRVPFNFEIAFVWKYYRALCRCSLYTLHCQRRTWDAFMNDISTPVTHMILAPTQENSGQDYRFDISMPLVSKEFCFHADCNDSSFVKMFLIILLFVKIVN